MTSLSLNIKSYCVHYFLLIYHRKQGQILHMHEQINTYINHVHNL